jgi:uncharacterized membrane protein YebE (DUF533 family)
MDAKAILEGLLEKSQRATQTGIQMAEDRKIIPPAGDERTAMLKGAGAGALAAGAIALLFGSKGTRKFVGKAAKLGGTAAIGGLAYKAYTDWQAQQQVNASQQQPQLDTTASSVGSLNLNQFEVGTPINDLADKAAQKRSEALMQAMITAARVDGHVDDDEMTLITQQINNLGLEQDVTRFLLSEMSKPVDVARIAALADSPEAAAELYIASAMVVDMDDALERAYLDKLAVAMNLDPQLVTQLEAPLRA